jgi:hypothetical protein
MRIKSKEERWGKKFPKKDLAMSPHHRHHSHREKTNEITNTRGQY